MRRIMSEKELHQFYKNTCSTKQVSFKEFRRNYYKKSEIRFPEECPKCRSKNVLHDDWADCYIIWVITTCQECHFSWREKIDLTI